METTLYSILSKDDKITLTSSVLLAGIVKIDNTSYKFYENQNKELILFLNSIPVFIQNNEVHSFRVSEDGVVSQKIELSFGFPEYFVFGDLDKGN